MEPLFPYANVVAGVLVLLVGFGFHFCGQLVSVVNWRLATKWGLQESNLRAEYKVYEHGIALADVLMGWLYVVAGVGLVIDAAWGYALASIPGAILSYHAISFWFWTRNRRKAGDRYYSTGFRAIWSASNLATGILALLVANTQFFTHYAK